MYQLIAARLINIILFALTLTFAIVGDLAPNSQIKLSSVCGILQDLGQCSSTLIGLDSVLEPLFRYYIYLINYSLLILIVVRDTIIHGLVIYIFVQVASNKQENDFSRVVNKMLMKDNARVYYPDGVEVQRLILPNGETFIQIKHVRFFKGEHGESHAIKYIGRLQLERPSLPGLEKMLSSPPFNIQVIGKEEEGPSPYQPRYIFTWDSMRYAALLDLGKRSDGLNQCPPIEFSGEMDSLQTTFLNENSSRIFQLGRFWNEELNSIGNMKCYVYTTANLSAMKYRIYFAKTKYNPRVAEYIDQKLYTLTQDEFDEIFTITNVRTWFCTDKADEFLRVETFYESTVIPFAVRYTDGVKVVHEKMENKELLKIRETVYINMMNSRVYKRNQNPDPKQADVLEFVIGPNTQRGGIVRKVTNMFKKK